MECNYLNKCITFDYFAMPYKGSDNTIVITLVCWPKHMNFGT